MINNNLIINILLAARIRYPYFATALAALSPVERPGLGTVAVDRYWRLYYDPAWLSGLTLDQAAHVVAAHELGHLLRDHSGRCVRCCAAPCDYNIAGDAEINDDIVADLLPAGHVRPSTLGAPDGLFAEDYLDYIQPGQDQGWPCGGGSGAGQPLDG